MNYDVLVVGGGASGLVAAIFAARAGARTAILEHKDKIGKKILATGNGKCNYTNLVQNEACYRGEHPEFATKVLNSFDENDTLEFFKELGILPKVRNGYVYPYSEQASSIVQVLSMELKRLKVDIFLNEHVVNIHKKKENLFLIETIEEKKDEAAPSKKSKDNSRQNHTVTQKKKSYQAQYVILAAGGCASTAHGSDGSGYTLAKSLGHRIIKPIPALTQLLAEGKYFKTIAGVRLEAKVQLFSDQELLTMEEGEVLFTNYGISGIPIFQISRFAGKSLELKKKTTLVLDFFPSIMENDMKQFMKERFTLGKHKSVEEILTGMLNQKLAYVLIKEAGINPEAPSGSLRQEDQLRLTGLLKGFSLKITGSNGFENAQVSAGGVDTIEINPQTLESKKTSNIFITGELLDIDGTCGGYNLQWAWSTGAIAGRNVFKV